MMQSYSIPVVNWITDYITRNTPHFTRFEIDRQLLDMGCKSLEIEAAWQHYYTRQRKAFRLY